MALLSNAIIRAIERRYGGRVVDIRERIEMDAVCFVLSRPGEPYQRILISGIELHYLKMEEEEAEMYSSRGMGMSSSRYAEARRRRDEEMMMRAQLEQQQFYYGSESQIAAAQRANFQPEECASCGKNARHTISHHLGWCEEKVKEFGEKVRRLFWHRYQKDKSILKAA